MSLLDRLLLAVVLVSALWWAYSRHRRPAALVGQTVHPDVMEPPPHPELQRLIDMRAADPSFVLDRLAALADTHPGSPLAGHVDLRHVGIVGHSLGGATAVQVMAADSRFKPAPALWVSDTPTMPQVLAEHASLRSERLVTATGV